MNVVSVLTDISKYCPMTFQSELSVLKHEIKMIHDLLKERQKRVK